MSSSTLSGPLSLATEDPPGALGEVSPTPGGTTPSPSTRLYQAGDIIAQKYRLTRVLGEGGMGAVWLARNVKLDVDVAIKLIRHELGSAGASDRLLQEARAAARIGHRSIVRVFDFGETELDDPFIVMEVLTGESLRQVLERKGRLPATHAVRALLPIASALCEAHASGIVHRDLKPENIMLVPKSAGVLPKLLDFGIAKFRRAEESADEESDGRSVVGTPDYMAPEQAGGHDDVDAGADVWALAVILYEAVTGKVPFSGPGYGALIFAIMTAEPTPTHEQMAGDAELWEIVKPALAKRDVERPTMRELGTQLARWAHARGVESDLAGTSLSAAWLHESTQSPFSELPPPVHDESPSDVAIPRPAALPAGLRAPEGLAPTEAPPAASREPVSKARPGRAVWPIAVGLAAVAVGLAVGLRPVSAPPLSAPAGSVAASPGASSSPESAPSASASAASASAPADSAVAPATTASGATASGASASGPDAGGPPLKPGKKGQRKGTLPIAKQPNF
jgi:serine/threonine-protein kinase